MVMLLLAGILKESDQRFAVASPWGDLVTLQPCFMTVHEVVVVNLFTKLFFPSERGVIPDCCQNEC